jgi:hypothetical protein
MGTGIAKLDDWLDRGGIEPEWSDRERAPGDRLVGKIPLCTEQCHRYGACTLTCGTKERREQAGQACEPAVRVMSHLLEFHEP